MTGLPPLGPALALLRQRRNLTQEAMAQRLGLAKNSVWRLESPKSNPRQDTLDRYLRALSCGVDDLYWALEELRQRRLREAPAAPQEGPLAHLGRAVDTLRLEAGLSVASLGRFSGVGEYELADFLDGTTGLRTESLNLVLQVLGATLGDLAVAAGDPLNLRKMREDYDSLLRRLAALEEAQATQVESSQEETTS